MNFTPKGILIDFDGTLIDAFEPIFLAWQATLQHFDHPTYSRATVRRMSGQKGVSFATTFGKENATLAREKFYEVHHALHLEHIHPLKGAENILKAMQQQHIPVVLLTNKVESCAIEQVAYLGWQPYFQHIIGAVPERPAKPDPFGVHLACQLIEEKENQCVVIGDGLNDMQAATQAGCHAIGICADFSATELQHAGATQCFNHLDEVSTWLSQNN